MYFLFSLWPFFAFGQVTNDFENGLGENWIQFPENRWESSTEQSISGYYSLHHSYDNTSSGKDRISLKTGIFDLNKKISWDFKIKYAYTTSSTNKWQIFLASDKNATEAAGYDNLSGYLIGVNITGSDDSLRLFGMEKGNLVRFGNALLNYENDIGTGVFHCQINRDAEGGWEIYAAKEEGDLILIATFQEPPIDLPELKHFMLSYNYTSSKDKLLWLDDLVIRADFSTDSIPPSIMGYKIPDMNSVVLEFSEVIDSYGFKLEQIRLFPGNIYPESIKFEQKGLKCIFSEKFIQKTTYQVITFDIKDMDANISGFDSITFIYYEAEKNDLVFTEIFADPSPPVYLPENEYVELYNRCEFPINLDSFTLQVGKREFVFPEFILDTGKYLVITSDNTVYQNAIPLLTSSSVIPNEGSQFFLRNKGNVTLAAAEFNGGWYQDDYKSQGGWSLERIDEDNLCGGKENWRPSEDFTGGTPGRQNSVQNINLDLSSPLIERLEFVHENKIRLIFSENIDPESIPAAEFFTLLPEAIAADSVIREDYFSSEAEIVFSEKFQSGQEYQLKIPEGISDCAGNPLLKDGVFRFGLPLVTGFTDLILSEILFTAFPGCQEYLEIYNISEKLLDLSDIRILVGSGNETGVPVIPLSIPVLIFPGDYVVLCKDKQSLLSCHDVKDEKMIIEVMDLPTFPDDGACIKLYNRSLELIDVFCYKPEDEFQMLSDIHGISLERLVLNRKTGDQSYWHSASSVAGFGTPGDINSQALSGKSNGKKMEILPEIFSPNNDGRDDILEMHYFIDKEGFVGTVAVFEPSGRIVRFLGENEILGTSGMFLWDGMDDKGNLCNTGLYLIYFEIWNLKGDKERFRKTAVLVRQ